jgi:hypothetical protein
MSVVTLVTSFDFGVTINCLDRSTTYGDGYVVTSKFTYQHAREIIIEGAEPIPTTP